MSTIAIAADTVSQPTPAPADDKEPTRPEEERPDPEGDPGVGDTTTSLDRTGRTR